MISIDLALKETLQELRNLFIPFYRKNAQRRANLDNIYRIAKIKNLNANTRLTEAQADRERGSAEKERAQAYLLLMEARKVKVETELQLRIVEALDRGYLISDDAERDLLPLVEPVEKKEDSSPPFVST